MLLIPNENMPGKCEECPCYDPYVYLCNVVDEDDYNGRAIDTHGVRQNWCPLIEVPPHGDLIDRDEFIAEQRHLYCENCERRKGMKNGKMKFVYDIGDAPCRACGYGDVLDDIDDAPTIIEAEGDDGL